MNNPSDNPNSNDSAVEQPHEPDAMNIQHWILGVSVPMALLTYGMYCIITESAWFPYEDGWFWEEYEYMELDGRSAMCMGGVYVCISTFLFSHIILEKIAITRLVGVAMSYLSLIAATGCFMGVSAFFIFDIFR